MTQEDIDWLEYAEQSIEKSLENGEPIFDFLDSDDLVDVCNTLFIILNEKIPNWRKEIEFDDEGAIL